jgi:hypothetical protein
MMGTEVGCRYLHKCKRWISVLILEGWFYQLEPSVSSASFPFSFFSKEGVVGLLCGSRSPHLLSGMCFPKRVYIDISMTF